MTPDDWKEYQRRLTLRQMRETEIRIKAGWSEEYARVAAGQAEILLDRAIPRTRQIIDRKDML